MFGIELTNEVVIDDEGVEYGRLGRVVLGAYEAQFRCSLRYWNMSDYLRQWREGLQRIALGAVSSCLITSAQDPRVAHWMSWWLLYRDGDDVVFHDAFLDSKQTPFRYDRPYQSVPERSITLDADEWTVPVADIIAFLGTDWDQPLDFSPPRPWSPTT